MIKMCVTDWDLSHQPKKLQNLTPYSAIVVRKRSSENVGLPTVQRVQGLQQSLQLDLEAHRRWNSSLSLGFVHSVDHVDINEARTGINHEVYYALEVYLSLPTSRLPTSPCNPVDASSSQYQGTHPTFKVERCFADFEELRENVLKFVSRIPQCTCRYCRDFLYYIRFKYSQPRGIAKLTSGTKKRKQILQTFINEFMIMGQRRAPTFSNCKCEAQNRVPAMLTSFLLNNARDY
ncbi:unnamed protein product [Peronospora belbahrii]|uniref:PX domain-containing protein n=1 Tax=Peronospora belbahrii TaxID=622444 RepID=A0ABN8CXT9_9STRA|nr:unnamed protein product [Peronospora belbahrii]